MSIRQCLNIQGLGYSGLTKLISWLLLPWLLASSGHQHPWYWLCRTVKLLSYMRKDVNYLCHVSQDEWYELYMFLINSSARKRFKILLKYKQSKTSFTTKYHVWYVVCIFSPVQNTPTFLSSTSRYWQSHYTHPVDGCHQQCEQNTTLLQTFMIHLYRMLFCCCYHSHTCSQQTQGTTFTYTF